MPDQKYEREIVEILERLERAGVVVLDRRAPARGPRGVLAHDVLETRARLREASGLEVGLAEAEQERHEHMEIARKDASAALIGAAAAAGAEVREGLRDRIRNLTADESESFEDLLAEAGTKRKRGTR